MEEDAQRNWEEIVENENFEFDSIDRWIAAYKRVTKAEITALF